MEPTRAMAKKLVGRLEPNMTEVVGTLATIRWHGNGFVIGMLEGGIVVKGPMLDPRVGTEYRMVGRVVHDPTWGDQFKFTDHEARIPTGAEAFAAYLQANAKWIGPATAAAITARYGTDAVRICREDPERVTREVKGITPTRALEISRLLKGVEAGESLEIEMRKILEGSGLGQSALVKIITAYGDNAPTKVRENPYVLAEDIEGIGFLKADKVALTVGYARDGAFRLRAGIVHVMDEQAGSYGHVCLPRSQLVLFASELLEVEAWAISKQLDWMVESQKVIEVVEGAEVATASGESVQFPQRRYIYTPKLYRDECAAAENVRALLATPMAPIPIPPAPADDRFPLHEDQREAIEKACANRVFVLTGAPGTGKTTTIQRIVASAGAGVVELAAPTGKAAKRIEEQSGIPARTMHRLLEPKPVGNGFVFQRDANNQIDADLIVIDETSMVDVTLAARFLEAVRPSTRVVFVGDAHQLPSVGPGNVLSELIQSGSVPFVELNTIKRQDGGGLIVRNCHAIKSGKPLELPPVWNNEDFVFAPAEGQLAIKQAIRHLMSEVLPNWVDLKGRSLDMLRDVQVIVPMRERTAISAAALNAMLRDVLNPEPFGAAPDAPRFRAGDKVIQTRNDYKLEIMNGDIGRVAEVDVRDKAIYVEFDTPRRTVPVPLHDNALELAYALTCHKFQGSEARVVIVPICASYGPMVADRRWLYTAVSRARDFLIMVGERDEVAKVVARNRPQRRNTRLAKMIREKVEAA